jgi:hypothetical protein
MKKENVPNKLPSPTVYSGNELKTLVKAMQTVESLKEIDLNTYSVMLDGKTKLVPQEFAKYLRDQAQKAIKTGLTFARGAAESGRDQYNRLAKDGLIGKAIRKVGGISDPGSVIRESTAKALAGADAAQKALSEGRFVDAANLLGKCAEDADRADSLERAYWKDTIEAGEVVKTALEGVRTASEVALFILALVATGGAAAAAAEAGAGAAGTAEAAVATAKTAGAIMLWAPVASKLAVTAEQIAYEDPVIWGEVGAELAVAIILQKFGSALPKTIVGRLFPQGVKGISLNGLIGAVTSYILGTGARLVQTTIKVTYKNLSDSNQTVTWKGFVEKLTEELAKELKKDLKDGKSALRAILEGAAFGVAEGVGGEIGSVKAPATGGGTVVSEPPASVDAVAVGPGMKTPPSPGPPVTSSKANLGSEITPTATTPTPGPKAGLKAAPPEAMPGSSSGTKTKPKGEPSDVTNVAPASQPTNAAPPAKLTKASPPLTSTKVAPPTESTDIASGAKPTVTESTGPKVNPAMETGPTKGSKPILGKTEAESPTPLTNAASESESPVGRWDKPRYKAGEYEEAFADLRQEIKGLPEDVGPVVGRELGRKLPTDKASTPGKPKKTFSDEEKAASKWREVEMASEKRKAALADLKKRAPEVLRRIKAAKVKIADPDGKISLEDLAVREPDRMVEFHKDWIAGKAKGKIKRKTSFGKYVKKRLAGDRGYVGEQHDASVVGTRKILVKAPKEKSSVRGSDAITYDVASDRIEYRDVKSVQSDSSVGKVSALEKNLPKNLGDDITAIEKYMREPDVPDVIAEKVLPRLKAAKTELDAYIKKENLKPEDLYTPKVRDAFDSILRNNGIDRVVSLAGAGEGAGISEPLGKGAGFRAERP